MPIPIPTIAAVRAAIAGFWPTMRLILFIAAIAFGAVQTVRLEGFRFWPLSIEGALPKVARLETDLANVREAQALAEQEAARIHPGDQVRAACEVGDGLAHLGQAARVGQHRCQVLELDARLGKIGHLAQQGRDDLRDPGDVRGVGNVGNLRAAH